MPALLTERQDHLLIVTLNRPERQNAINGEMLVRLFDASLEADTTALQNSARVMCSRVLKMYCSSRIST
jgi:enoyl-CoA hydratase/carnithine racemase